MLTAEVMSDVWSPVNSPHADILSLIMTAGEHINFNVWGLDENPYEIQ